MIALTFKRIMDCVAVMRAPVQMSGLLQFAVRQGAETESYMTSVERIAEYAKLDTEPSVVKATESQPSDSQNPLLSSGSGPSHLSAGVIAVRYFVVVFMIQPSTSSCSVVTSTCLT